MTKPGSGLRGKDKQQGKLRDKRNGAYDSPDANRREPLPEGLVRKRMGPYSKRRGRGGAGNLGNQR
jgi:hypothetical protein